MMRIPILFLAVSSLALSVSAQSGRRIAPTPTPEEPTYSESTPQPRRPRGPVFPSLRNGTNTSQQPSGQSTGNAGRPASNIQPGDSENVLQRVETNLVTIPVSVFDRHGLYIPNLKKEDFRIFEDGKEQQIEYFGTSEKPFTVVMVIDVSPSTKFEIDEIRDAAIAFVNQLKPQDKVMVIEFDRKIRVLTELTGDRTIIRNAINMSDFGSGTALYDAVNFSLTKTLNSVSGRKAVVLFTDGVDTQSTKANADMTLATAEESDSMVFPIYYNTYDHTKADAYGTRTPPAGTTEREYIAGKKYLDDLAAYTGGRVFQAGSTPGGLTAAFEGIAEELRRQYNLGYIPIDDGKPGQRRHIKVRVNRPNLALRARDSYIVGSK